MGDHATVQIESINKARVSMLEFRLRAGINRDRVYKRSIVRADHLNSATLFAMAPHCALAMQPRSTGDTKLRDLSAISVMERVVFRFEQADRFLRGRGNGVSCEVMRVGVD